jgi:hypothetical protein
MTELENTAMASALSEKLTDTERLDKLERYILADTGARIYNREVLDGNSVWRNKTPKYRGLLSMSHGHFRSIREAIDAL